jgi:hypothetical protein
VLIPEMTDSNRPMTEERRGANSVEGRMLVHVRVGPPTPPLDSGGR